MLTIEQFEDMAITKLFEETIMKHGNMARALLDQSYEVRELAVTLESLGINPTPKAIYERWFKEIEDIETVSPYILSRSALVREAASRRIKELKGEDS